MAETDVLEDHAVVVVDGIAAQIDDVFIRLVGNAVDPEFFVSSHRDDLFFSIVQIRAAAVYFEAIVNHLGDPEFFVETDNDGAVVSDPLTGEFEYRVPVFERRGHEPDDAAGERRGAGAEYVEGAEVGVIEIGWHGRPFVD